MMRFATLLKHPADWMTGDKVDNAVVLTSRVRLARNLEKYPFPGWAHKKQREEIRSFLQPEVQTMKCMKDGFSKSLDKLTAVRKQVLVERHLISREHAARGAGSAVVISRNQKVSIMVNEEDHLRMQVIHAGGDLSGAYKEVSDGDDYLAKYFEYAYDLKWGYLTTCPTNLGTGMRASSMLHLPGLVLSEQIGQVIQAVNKIGLAVRGIFGEGSESLGHLFQISNQSTLGESENAILERLERVIGQVAKSEQNAREKLMESDGIMLADNISRAYGILQNAYLISSKEALDYISMVRLGANINLFPKEIKKLCDALLMDIQPGHLQLYAKRKLPPKERDQIRAEIIRLQLQNCKSPDTLKLLTNGEDNSPTEDNSE